jgi:PilZ domain.
MIQHVSHVEKDFLIKTVFQNEQPVRFHGISTAGTGLITMVDRTMLAVTLLDTADSNPFSICEHITGYFDCHGNTYAFETTVRDSKQKQIRIDPPVKLLRSLQRKYVRVRKPKNLKVIFRLANEEIRMNYPVCPEYVSVEEPESESSLSARRLPELIAGFKERLSDKCYNNTIIMFRTKKPEYFEEELISRTGKVLFIPSTVSELPKNDPYPEGRIITQKIEESFEDPNYFVEGSRFDKLLKQKKDRGISSEIWCPIVYYQYVVGYIYVVNSGSESFDVSMVDYLWDFSRILAWQLKQSGYFDSESFRTDPVNHVPHILDMSPGGMLVSLPDNEIRTPVREGSIFSVEIFLPNNTIRCSSRVTRRYVEEGSVSYGTVFLDLSSGDMMKLYEFLYRKSFNDHDPIAYEQQKKSDF